VERSPPAGIYADAINDALHVLTTVALQVWTQQTKAPYPPTNQLQGNTNHDRRKDQTDSFLR
jgi:hypothetical protein